MNDPKGEEHMSDGIHRINDIIKQVSGLRYDCSAGIFETDRRALYDFAKLIIDECEKVVDWEAAYAIKEHFEEKS